MKSREEVERLKQNWHEDSCWDIEKTEGFEDYRDELLAYRKQSEAEWEVARQKHHDKLASIKCPLAFYTYRTHQEGTLAITKVNTAWGNCQVERCAWWNDQEERCVVRVLTMR